MLLCIFVHMTRTQRAAATCLLQNKTKNAVYVSSYCHVRTYVYMTQALRAGAASQLISCVSYMWPHTRGHLRCVLHAPRTTYKVCSSSSALSAADLLYLCLLLLLTSYKICSSSSALSLADLLYMCLLLLLTLYICYVYRRSVYTAAAYLIYLVCT
jgi:hypothetical protein